MKLDTGTADKQTAFPEAHTEAPCASASVICVRSSEKALIILRPELAHLPAFIFFVIVFLRLPLSPLRFSVIDVGFIPETDIYANSTDNSLLLGAAPLSFSASESTGAGDCRDWSLPPSFLPLMEPIALSAQPQNCAYSPARRRPHRVLVSPRKHFDIWSANRLTPSACWHFGHETVSLSLLPFELWLFPKMSESPLRTIKIGLKFQSSILALFTLDRWLPYVRQLST